jgi:hypothetical protein
VVRIEVRTLEFGGHGVVAVLAVVGDRNCH